MAKPRVFVSSTYYDLKHVRNNLNEFIEGFGYDPVLYEEGDIPFHHDASLDLSCYEEIRKCHIMVLIVGGRYGSPSSDDQKEHDQKIDYYNSVTKKEYETARKEDIPIYIFIDKNVLAEYQTYKRNRENSSIEYAHVDNVNIFKLIEDIYEQKRNNLIKDFEKFDDISSWLKDQWAGLFADFLSNKSKVKELSDLTSQVSHLKELSSVLKGYTESILEKLQPNHFKSLIDSSNQKLNDRAFEEFAEHSLIRHLTGFMPKGAGALTLFNNFKESDDLASFLKRIDLPDEEFESLLNHSPAGDHFEELKRRF